MAPENGFAQKVISNRKSHRLVRAVSRSVLLPALPQESIFAGKEFRD